MAADFSHHIAIALLLGVVAGAIWSRLWPLIASQPNANILNLGVVFGVYALTRYVGGSGLLAVLVFGITLANLPRTPHMTRQGARLLAFHAELSFLVRSFFFVLLGIVAEFVSRKYLLPIVGILAALLLARFLAVQGSRWAVRDVTRRETELLFWMLPTRFGHGGVGAGDRQRARSGVRLPARDGIHRRPGDQLVCGGGSREVGEGLGPGDASLTGSHQIDGRIETAVGGCFPVPSRPPPPARVKSEGQLLLSRLSELETSKLGYGAGSASRIEKLLASMR